jgi:hypothetical protein
MHQCREEDEPNIPDVPTVISQVYIHLLVRLECVKSKQNSSLKVLGQHSGLAGIEEDDLQNVENVNFGYIRGCVTTEAD